MRLRAGLTVILSAHAGLAAAQAPARTAFTADFGFVSATGNTRLATLNFNEKVTHTIRSWVLTQMSGYVYGKTNGVSSANQLRTSLRGDHTFLRNVAVFAGASYERNTFAGFDRRTDEFLGLAWKALAAARDTLSIDAGGVLTQESLVDGTSRDFPAGRLAGAFKHGFGGASYFVQLAEYLPNFQTSGAYRLNTESSLVAPVSKHLGVKVTYNVRYDSKPPVSFGTTDRVLTTGLQVTY
ncbi:MAG TPA: DUF481 domain-containing protein [Gemmatimonadaceae bacterium]|nr:DUF481 domain-containing protein [Gemmatimonadaceae bacterium]